MKNKFLGTGTPGYHPITKVKIVLNGCRYAFQDISVAYKLILSAIILLFSFIFDKWIDSMIIVVATGQLLASEMFNTAIEAVCDFMETKENAKIAVIKDMSAAAAGISIAVWAIAIVYEYTKMVIMFLR